MQVRVCVCVVSMEGLLLSCRHALVTRSCVTLIALCVVMRAGQDYLNCTARACAHVHKIMGLA